ncbi:hypothetical protein PH552_33445 [Rhizobium sp. CNPSo 3968]|uniref:hypothetical protein n=1 Tax=Rhizobium sp. CNPSo 3968 TaxID=3021408 RepID=UPI00254C9153|nr:hypothetical protein [Rhizobium sp. CNPSo 3968]MDK4724251.1 hypothetical protein [Rhizobium sp. CNPSo 3968]
MLTTHRDCKQHVKRNAIPSLGEIEGRVAVLEIVAQSALAHVFDDGEVDIDAALLAQIRRAMHRKCKELKLDGEDTASALSYAEELIEAAVRASHPTHQ